VPTNSTWCTLYNIRYEYYYCLRRPGVSRAHRSCASKRERVGDSNVALTTAAAAASHIGPAPRRLAFHYHCSSARARIQSRQTHRYLFDHPPCPVIAFIPVLVYVYSVCVCIIMYIRCNSVLSPVFPSRRRRRRPYTPYGLGQVCFAHT